MERELTHRQMVLVLNRQIITHERQNKTIGPNIRNNSLARLPSGSHHKVLRRQTALRWKSQPLEKVAGSTIETFLQC